MNTYLSDEQLSELAGHALSISTILLKACQAAQVKEEMPGTYFESLVGIPNDADLRSLCGYWKGKEKKQPDVHIFKADPGYMISFGKTDEKNKILNCHLIFDDGPRLFNAGKGAVCLTYDLPNDTMSLWPGGEYIRVKK